jgi:hypothetical protein
VDGGTAEVMTSITHLGYFFFEPFAGLVFSLTVFAKERTQRKPI